MRGAGHAGVMRALQAINDHRDAGAHLDNVRAELAHVNAVTRRALERLGNV